MTEVANFKINFTNNFEDKTFWNKGWTITSKQDMYYTKHKTTYIDMQALPILISYILKTQNLQSAVVIYFIAQFKNSGSFLFFTSGLVMNRESR